MGRPSLKYVWKSTMPDWELLDLRAREGSADFRVVRWKSWNSPSVDGSEIRRSPVQVGSEYPIIYDGF